MGWLTEIFQSNLAGTRLATTKRVIEQFADEHGLVYFGHVDQHEDEHKLVRGVTVSAAHQDQHYCIGTIQDYDVVLLQRTDTLQFPNKPTRSYSWLIMQIDLKRTNHHSGHLFLDGHHYDETFYAHLFTKHNRLHKVDRGFLEGHEALFVRGFDVYAPPDQNWFVSQILTHEVTAMLGHHFRDFDFEVTKEHLFVYAGNPVITPHLLQYMSRGGLWLAGCIDKSSN